MSAAALAKAMKAAGCSLEQIVVALEHYDALNVPARSARSERNARYYAEHKEEIKAKRLKASDSSEIKTDKTAQDVPAESQTAAPEAPRAPAVVVSLNNNTPPQNPTGSSAPSKSERPRKADQGTRLPEGWVPSDEGWGNACRLLGRERAERELQKLRNWAANAPRSKAFKRNWERAWENWVLGAVDRLPTARAGPSQSSRGLTMAEIATGSFRTKPDVEPPANHPIEHHPASGNPRAAGFAGRLSERDRADGGGPLLDFGRASAGRG